MTVTTEREVQPHKLQLERNHDGQIVFSAHINLGGMVLKREVTVVDESCNVLKLMKAIQRDETNVTNLNWSGGDIHLEEDGRQYLVAKFTADNDESVEIDSIQLVDKGWDPIDISDITEVELLPTPDEE